METINSRIVEYCKQKGIRQVDLEKAQYGSKQSINMIFNNKRKPNCTFLEKLVSDNEDLDARWLITGKKEQIG